MAQVFVFIEDNKHVYPTVNACTTTSAAYVHDVIDLVLPEYSYLSTTRI